MQTNSEPPAMIAEANDSRTAKAQGGCLQGIVGHPGNEIRQHIPDFCEGFDKATAAFDSLDELLKIPFVANFMSSPNFHQFSVSDNHLMAEYRGGREWWVVGYLKNPNIGLPAWNHGIYEVWDKHRKLDVPGNLVASSCGDDVTLGDGRTLKRRGR